MNDRFFFSRLLLFLVPLFPVQAMYNHWYLAPRTVPAGRERPMLSIQTHQHTDEIYERHFVRFVYGFTVRRITRYQSDGITPAEIKITYRNDVYLRPEFQPGTHTYQGRGLVGGNTVTVRMLDDAEEPTVRDPAYFELSRKPGERILLVARSGKDRPFGAVIRWQNRGEPSMSLADLGFEIFTDDQGRIEQVRTPTHLATIEDSENGGYTVTVFDDIENQPPILQEGRYIPPENLKPAPQSRLWNPNPGDSSQLRLHSKLKDGTDTYYQWTVNTLGDYDLDRCDENWEVLYPRNRRWMSEDQKSYFRQSGVKLCSGKIRVTTSRSERIGGEWRLMERRRKIEDEETVAQYSRYSEPESLRGKIRHIVYCDGNWTAYEYDESGSKTGEIRPEAFHRTLVEYEEDPHANEDSADDLLGGLLDSFTDGAPEGMRRVTRTVTEYKPPFPPGYREN